MPLGHLRRLAAAVVVVVVVVVIVADAVGGLLLLLVEALLLHPLAGRGAGAIVLEVVGGLLRQQEPGGKDTCSASRVSCVELCRDV